MSERGPSQILPTSWQSYQSRASATLIDAQLYSISKREGATPDAVRSAQEEVRHCYALRPDVRVLVEALLEDGIKGVKQRCTLHLGVPMQPMLAKACTSIQELLKRILGSMPHKAKRGWCEWCEWCDAGCRVQVPASFGEYKYNRRLLISRSVSESSLQLCVVVAPKSGRGAGRESRKGASEGEHAVMLHGCGICVSRTVQTANACKYDGQRAQIHVLPGSTVKIFSRKLDDMTYKYPDVVKAVLRSSRMQVPCVLDAEIVAVVPKESNTGEAESSKDLEGKDSTKGSIEAFQSLATRKRKNVTEANAATASVAVKVFLFDLLFLGEEPLISLPFHHRREKLRQSFAEVEDLVAYAEAEDLEGSAGTAEATLEAALRRSVAMSCEGLMVKHLGSGYEPSTKRSDCWLKLKKDYVESMGDSLDLPLCGKLTVGRIPIGGWRGSGRKSRWVSPWLLATYDPVEGTFGSVCRVMSGFSDQFYKENTIRYLGRELQVGGKVEEAHEGGLAASSGGEEADEEEDIEVESADSAAAEEEARFMSSRSGSVGMQLRSKAEGVETLEQPRFWFQPSEVWEIRGAAADPALLVNCPRHHHFSKAFGCEGRLAFLVMSCLVDPKRGLSLRFPRFIRKREDKRLDQATTPQQLAELCLQPRALFEVPEKMDLKHS
ncbi:adl1 [Symbiodinium natans]|uniref:Adl1 protein n=1 Tax=Symbiodinium natans TaxID=878477 RepID=A0A812HXC3_9DINO|nr:adl1 [Symbiodinium natans]